MRSKEGCTFDVDWSPSSFSLPGLSRVTKVSRIPSSLLQLYDHVWVCVGDLVDYWGENDFLVLYYSSVESIPENLEAGLIFCVNYKVIGDIQIECQIS